MDNPKLFVDYFWKEGSPKGTSLSRTGSGYKIVSDPYLKHISIEKYTQGRFTETIYDSSLLDFRKLKPTEHLAWQRELLVEKENHTESLLRNQDDRVLFKEICIFDRGLCRECKTLSIHGMLLSVHRMFYTKLQDHTNELILYDNNAHMVMTKRYAADTMTGEFTELLEESWDPNKAKV